MQLPLPRGLWTMALIVMGLVASFALVACGDDDNGDNGGSGSSSDMDVLTAITVLDNAGLHEMDDEINKDGEAPPNGETIARHMETVVRLTAWPDELKATADRLVQVFADLGTELGQDNIDMEKAGELAAQAHDLWHDLSHDTWAYLASQAGVEAAGGGHQ